MLLPSPELAKRLEKYQTIDPVEAEATKLEWNRLKRHRNTLLRTVAGIALLGVGVSGYVNDVRNNQELQASASISVDGKGEALDEAHNDNALVFIDGFNTPNANILTKYMGPAIQPVIDGRLWSVDYNNAALDPSEIAKRIIEKAERQNVRSISLIGYSAGGDIAMQVQEEIRNLSYLTVETIFLISTPDGIKVLNQARQDEIKLVENFAWLPDVEYSTAVRFIGEIAFRSDRYTKSDNPIQNILDFFTTAGQVKKSMDANKLPGAWLMFDQLLAIENADIERHVLAMKDIPEDQVRPTIVYLINLRDYMLDNIKASTNIASYAEGAGISFLSYDVPNAVHTRIDLSAEENIQVLLEASPEIIASIEAAKSEASLHRVTSPIIQPLLPTDDEG